MSGTDDTESLTAAENTSRAGQEPDVEHPDVILCPGGPMLLRGDHVVQDEDGTEHRTTRPVSAVCRCGASSIKPWCDGTHKVLQKREKCHQDRKVEKD